MSSGIIFASLALCGFGCSTFLVRIGLIGVIPRMAATISIASSCLLLLALVTIFYSKELVSIEPLGFLWALAYGIVTFSLARVILYTAFGLAGATRVAPILSVMPIFAAIFAMIILGEKPNFLIIMGIILSVLGMILILGDRNIDVE